MSLTLHFHAGPFDGAAIRLEPNEYADWFDPYPPAHYPCVNDSTREYIYTPREPLSYPLMIASVDYEFLGVFPRPPHFHAQIFTKDAT